MLGANQLVIDASDFTRGMSSSNELPDGGFSPDTDAVNLLSVPGVIYAPALPVDKSTNATGHIIASCEDPSGTYQRLLVSTQLATDDGQLYSADTDGDLTVRGSEDTTNNYIQGRCDMVAYKGEAYITTNEEVIRWSSIGSSNTIDTSFFTFNSSLAPHPAQVFEDNVYYGDGNLLRQQTSAGGAPTTILTLPTGSIIVALGIDSGSGKMLISYIGQYNVSGTINTFAKVGFYDGNSLKLSKTVLVEEMVTAFPVSGGTLYCAYGNNLGLWNGAGITFLRKFTGIAYDNTELMYKQHFTNIGNTLYFIDNLQIIAHGAVRQGGNRVFYPVYKNNESANNLFHVYNLGNNLLGFSYSTDQHFTVDISSVASTNTMAFVTNHYRFPRPVVIDSVYIEWVDAVADAATPVTIAYTNRSVIGSSGSFLATAVITNNSGSAIRETFSDVLGMASDQGRVFSFRFSTATNNYGIARVIFYYHVKE